MACAQLEAAADPVDRAVRFFVNCRQSLAETLPVQSVGPLVWLGLPICFHLSLPDAIFVKEKVLGPQFTLRVEALRK